MQTPSADPQGVVAIRTGHVRLRADGIMEIEMNPGVDVDIRDADEIVAVQESLAKGQRYPTLVKMGLMKSISRDARNRVAGGTTSLIISAVGLVTHSPVSRVIGNFMMGFNKATYPTRLFASEEEAVAWLFAYKK